MSARQHRKHYFERWRETHYRSNMAPEEIYRAGWDQAVSYYGLAPADEPAERLHPRVPKAEMADVSQLEAEQWVAVLAEMHLIIRHMSGRRLSIPELRRALSASLGIERTLYDAATHEPLGPATRSQEEASSAAYRRDGSGEIRVGGRICYVAPVD